MPCFCFEQLSIYYYVAVTQFSDKVRVRRLSFAGHSFKSENQAVSQVILTLNQSSSSSRWQVASTRDRHCCCSAARLAMVSHVTLNPVIYFFNSPSPRIFRATQFPYGVRLTLAVHHGTFGTRALAIFIFVSWFLWSQTASLFCEAVFH